MARAIILSILLTGLGCAQARYVEKGSGEGIVAVPSNSDCWPTRNRTKALTLIEEHVGQDYEIVQEFEVARGSSTTDSESARTEPSVHESETSGPIGQSKATQATEYRIQYRESFRSYRPMHSWKYKQSDSEHLIPVRIHGGIL